MLCAIVPAVLVFSSVASECLTESSTVQRCIPPIEVSMINSATETLILIEADFCVTALDIKNHAPALEFISVDGDQKICPCLIQSELPCGLTLIGCSRFPVQGVCSATNHVLHANGTTTTGASTVGLAVGLGFTGVTVVGLGAALILLVIRYKKLQSRRLLDETAHTMTSVASQHDPQEDISFDIPPARAIQSTPKKEDQE